MLEEIKTVNLNKAGKNAIWMMVEKTISIFGLFFITSYVAKYIGPSLFGELSLAMAIFQIVLITSQMGCDNIIFKRVSKKPQSGVSLIKASFTMRACLYFLLSAPVLIYFYEKDKFISFIFCTSVSLAYLFSALDVYSIYNNATLSSKINTFSNVIGLVVGLGIRYAIAKLMLNPALLSIPIVLTTAIPFFIRMVYFKKKNDNVSIIGRNWVSSAKKYSRYLLISGGSIVLSSISIAIYTRINQIYISDLIGTYQLGIYSVALTLSTSWSFVVSSIITSYYASIYADDDSASSMKKASNLNRFILLFSMFFLLIFWGFGKEVINILYGERYVGAYVPVLILSVGTMFSLMGSVAYKYVIKYSGFSYLSKKMIFILIFSIPTSFFLTKYYGINGASISVVLVELLSLTIMNYFFKNRIVMKMHFRSLGVIWN